MGDFSLNEYIWTIYIYKQEMNLLQLLVTALFCQRKNRPFLRLHPVLKLSHGKWACTILYHKTNERLFDRSSFETLRLINKLCAHFPGCYYYCTFIFFLTAFFMTKFDIQFYSLSQFSGSSLSWLPHRKTKLP